MGERRGFGEGGGVSTSPHSPAAKNTDVFRGVFICSRSSSVFLRLLKEWVEKFSVKSRFREIWSCSRE